MDPCPFVRLLVGNLMLKLPPSSLPTTAARGVHPFNDTPCYCKIRLMSDAGNGRVNFRSQSQTAAVAVLLPTSPVHDSDSTSTTTGSNSSPQVVAAAFDIGPSDLARLAGTVTNDNKKKGSNKPVLPPLTLRVEIYTGRRRATCFGLRSSGKLLGKVSVPVDILRGAAAAELKRSAVYHNGWVSLGEPDSKAGKKTPELHLTVRSDPDPRFVFEFDAEPQCSPLVFQIPAAGGIRQPVFTCKFSRRTAAGATDQYRAPFSSTATTPDSDLHPSCSSSSWLGSFGSADGDRRQNYPSADGRKGWSVTVHDLSGSPVAKASMSTPFVASRGTDRVTRSSPGEWLVMRPGDGTWVSWGKLEAWREPGSSDDLACRFHLVPDNSNNNNSVTCSGPVVVAETTINTRKGGKFAVDFLTGSAALANNNNSIAARALPTNSTTNGGSRSRSRHGSRSATPTPGCTPPGSGDLSNALWPWNAYRGFVMSSTVEREGKPGRPRVEIGAHNVACTDDAALFVALAAAVDLSMDACTLFSHKRTNHLHRDYDD